MKSQGEQVIKLYDERRDIAIPGDSSTTVAFAVGEFLDSATNAIEDHGYFAVALAGGSTPQAIYKQLSNPKNHKVIDWKKVLVFWSDERCVPLDHADSNYRMAMEAGIGSLPIPRKNIYPMMTDEDPEVSALAYERLIQEVVPGGVFDLVLLGMGDDGHTASLFPKTHGLHPNVRLVIANFVPQKDVWRLTLTFDCINEAHQSVISVMGASKAKAVYQVLAGPYDPDSYPAQRVGTAEHKALWILDRDAASLIKK